MADNNQQTEHRFDESGSLITDQNFEGESRTFEELEQSERDAFIGTQKAEVSKLTSIVNRKAEKVKALTESLKDDEELDDDGNVIKKDPASTDKDKDVSNPDSDSLKKDVEELKLSKMGYDDEVIKEIMDLGGLSALDNSLIKKSADELQAEIAVRKASDIDEGSQGQTKTKFSKDDLSKMSSEEMEKVLPHAE